jgi:anti-sigma-K factor RskA
VSDEAHRRYEEELAAYLLDSLEVEEAREFELHLRSCAACQREERWLRGAVELLPSSVEQVEPPPELRERLMETVEAEAATRGAASRRGHDRWRRLLPRIAPRLRPAMALGATIVALGGIAGYLIGRGSDEPSASTVAARATPVAPDARATIVRTDDAAVLNVQRLRQPGPGRVYEVWLVRKGSEKPEPSALFSVHRNGTGAAGIPGGLDGVEQVMVSSEPARGSQQPSTKPVLVANL